MPNIYLYSMQTNEVQEQAGLNWCFSHGNVSNQDAYIALTHSFFRENPSFFPEHGSVINVAWDDGTEMRLLLEGTQSINGETKPKQISTVGDKSILGRYLRGRLNIDSTHRIVREDLQNYGREEILVTFDEENQRYLFDFSV